MMIRSTKDFWAGLIYILFGSTAILVGRDYQMGTAFRMGLRIFPQSWAAYFSSLARFQ